MLRDADIRAVCAVCGAEGVIDKNAVVAERRELFRVLLGCLILAVLGLLDAVARIFKEQHLAVL